MESAVAAIVLLGVLIFVHELGHFLVAKKVGVLVEKFSLGFGKTLLSKTVGETEYLLSAIPLGGYVKLAGEDPDDDDEVDPERSFSEKSVWARLAIVVAGPVFNLVFAVLILALVYMVGVQMPSDKSLVGKLKAGFPAEKAGLLEGDLILEIDGKKIEGWIEMAETIHDSPGKELQILIQRGRESLTIPVIPQKEVIKDLLGKDNEVGLIGIQPLIILERFGPLDSLYYGAKKTWEITYLTFWGIQQMIVGNISAKNLGGPLFIGQKAGEVANQGFASFVGFTAMISINLGILNLLPIPILDGGHILFFLIEILMKKPLSVRIREKAQQAGLAVLLSLMVFAFYNDIMRFVEQ